MTTNKCNLCDYSTAYKKVLTKHYYKNHLELLEINKDDKDLIIVELNKEITELKEQLKIANATNTNTNTINNTRNINNTINNYINIYLYPCKEEEMERMQLCISAALKDALNNSPTFDNIAGLTRAAINAAKERDSGDSGEEGSEKGSGEDSGEEEED